MDGLENDSLVAMAAELAAGCSVGLFAKEGRRPLSLVSSGAVPRSRQEDTVNCG